MYRSSANMHRFSAGSLSELPRLFDPGLDLEIWRKPVLEGLTDEQRQEVCDDLMLRVVKVVRPGLGTVLPLILVTIGHHAASDTGNYYLW